MPASTISMQPLSGQACTNFKLHKLARLVGRRYDAALAPTGLTTAQFSLMNHLHRLGSMRPVDLAQAMGLTPSTLTRNLQPLVAQGLALLEAGADRRSRLITLTAQGQAKRTEALACWRDAQQALSTLLGAQQVAQLHALLDDCTQVVDNATAPHNGV